MERKLSFVRNIYFSTYCFILFNQILVHGIDMAKCILQGLFLMFQNLILQIAMISEEKHIKICIPLCYLYIQVDRDKRNHAQVVGRFHCCGRGLRSIRGKPASGRKEFSQKQNTPFISKQSRLGS